MQRESPEERLLRLIKGDHKRGQRQRDSIRQPSSGSENITLARFINKIFIKSKIFKPSFLKPVNTILTVLLVISLGYLIYIFLSQTGQDVSNFTQESIEFPAEADTKLQRGPTLSYVPNYIFYSKKIGQKELFSPPFIKETKIIKTEDFDISKRFNLVGIIEGDEPQAIIEDTQMRKTHYLNRGQSFSGVIVEEIGDGRVVLHYKGKEITLVL